MARPLIMIVDDDAPFADTLAHLLNISWRYRSIPAYSAKEALRQIEANQTFFGLGRNRIKLIILDLSLPDMDGLEFLKVLRQKFGQRLGVIILSAYEDAEKWDKAAAGFVLNYIKKPFEPKELISTIDRFFEGQKGNLILETFRKHVRKLAEWKNRGS